MVYQDPNLIRMECFTSDIIHITHQLRAKSAAQNWSKTWLQSQKYRRNWLNLSFAIQFSAHPRHPKHRYSKWLESLNEEGVVVHPSSSINVPVNAMDCVVSDGPSFYLCHGYMRFIKQWNSRGNHVMSNSWKAIFKQNNILNFHWVLCCFSAKKVKSYCPTRVVAALEPLVGCPIY